MPITASPINLSDPFSTLVNKTNDIITDVENIDSSVGNLATLTTVNKTDLVSAVNEIHAVFANTQADSAGGISYDSSDGFSIRTNSITSSFFKDGVTLQIKSAAGSTLKTLYSPGS